MCKGEGMYLKVVCGCEDNSVRVAGELRSRNAFDSASNSETRTQVSYVAVSATRAHVRVTLTSGAM